MGDAKQEARCLADAAKNAAEFRRKHNISQPEWDRAVAMAAELNVRLADEFWEIYDANPANDRRGNS